MAARTRQKTKDIDVGVEAFARSQEWATCFTARECAAEVGCGESTAKRRLTRLVESGLLSSSTSHGYALIRLEDSQPWQARQAAKAATGAPNANSYAVKADFSDDAPVDPAPLTEAPEQSATPAAPSPTLQESPGAGITTTSGAADAMTVDWFTPQIGRIEPSEVDVLGYLEAMDDDARDRVLTYAASRWPTHCEVVVRADGMPSSEQIAEAVLGFVKGAGQ